MQAWIDAQGTNKRQLSLATRISRTTIDEIIKGSRPAELETIARIAAALNTTLGSLLDGKLPDGQVATPPASGDRLEALVSRVDALAELPAQVEEMARQLASALTDLQSMRTLLQSRGIA